MEKAEVQWGVAPVIIIAIKLIRGVVERERETKGVMGEEDKGAEDAKP